ncbi:MAG: ParB/RepB/Spo0J family partition protein [Thermoanaerobaculia bacterium]|nr:ParB/RepB/Spo0J family partition protein [Thermoanaerobaculia bacterium]
MSAKRRGLGRGLDALLRPAESSVHRLPVEELEPNRHQPRRGFDEAALEELADSIRAQGLVQPLVVTPREKGGYTIVAGERRWRAARIAGMEEVPVVLREVSDDRELLELALVENLQRADLNPIEEALAYQALREDFDLSQEEIAERVGKARSTVANAVRLLNLHPEVQTLVRDGKLAPGQARPLLSLGAGEEQARIAEKAVEKGWTARELERIASDASAGESPTRSAKKTSRRNVHDEAAADSLTRHWQTKVEIRRRRRGGTVRIHFHSEEELMRIYERLMEGKESS